MPSDQRDELDRALDAVTYQASLVVAGSFIALQPDATQREVNSWLNGMIALRKNIDDAFEICGKIAEEEFK